MTQRRQSQLEVGLRVDGVSSVSTSLDASRETVSHAGTPDVIWLSVFFFPQGLRARPRVAFRQKDHPGIISRGDDHRESALKPTTRETAAGS